MKLRETLHPKPDIGERFEALIGLERHKKELLETLLLLLDSERTDQWIQRHHRQGLPMLKQMLNRSPLILLSGDVGCGKTELAQTITTILAKELDGQLISLETPSDIRGTGLVGELSSRITEAFTLAASKVKRYRGGVLIIDEADDLATSRAQMQAHHEDRAGVNVLIRQIDQLERDAIPLAVLLITNRADALDPAVTRRAGLHLHFDRPGDEARAALFSRMLGTLAKPEEIQNLVEMSRRDLSYSYSDLVHRVGRTALIECIHQDLPLSPQAIIDVLDRVTPSASVLKGDPHV